MASRWYYLAMGRRRRLSDTDIREAMREMGSKGGKARAARLSAERRAEISEKAARAARARFDACTHENQEQRQIGQELRTYCISCRRRLARSTQPA